MIVLPQVVTKYQNNIFNHAYTREVQSISDLISQLYVDEHAGDFHNTYMYLDEEPESYDDSSGKFLKKYFRTSLYCSDDKTKCFGKKYYNYENRTKKVYTFEPKGSCALLKNGMSICISPQIGDNPISGWIDLNGKKGPNVKDRDLREFSIDPETKTALDTTTKNIRLYCDDHPDASVCKASETEEEETPVDNCPDVPTVSSDPCCADNRYSGLAVCQILEPEPSLEPSNSYDVVTLNCSFDNSTGYSGCTNCSCTNERMDTYKCNFQTDSQTNNYYLVVEWRLNSGYSWQNLEQFSTANNPKYISMGYVSESGDTVSSSCIDDNYVTTVGKGLYRYTLYDSSYKQIYTTTSGSGYYGSTSTATTEVTLVDDFSGGGSALHFEYRVKL